MTLIEDTARSGERQISSEPATSRAWWFLGTLAVLRNPVGAPLTPAVIELIVPPWGSPPRHVHETLDDSFLVLDGEMVVRCGDEVLVARAGTYVALPHGVEHTFRVTSRVPARLLLVHADDSFLRFIESVGTPTDDRRLPPPGGFDLDIGELMRVSAEHGAPMVGPSLDEEEARSYVAAAGPGDTTLGPVNHISLHVTDLARSEQWYIEALGLVRVDGEIGSDGHGHLVMLSPDGGWLVTLAGPAAPGMEHFALSCPDRDSLVRWRETLLARDIDPGNITDAAYGSGFVLRDPDGLEVELFAAGQQVDSLTEPH